MEIHPTPDVIGGEGLAAQRRETDIRGDYRYMATRLL
jgi:hypothetical protein